MKYSIFIIAIIICFIGQLYSQSIDSTITINQDNENDIQELGFGYIEDLPEFPGGIDSLRVYLQSKILINKDSIINGRVYVQFWIDTSGNVIDAEVIRGINNYQDNEALRIINSMPKWKPGVYKGKKIKFPFTYPIIFKRED